MRILVFRICAVTMSLISKDVFNKQTSVVNMVLTIGPWNPRPRKGRTASVNLREEMVLPTSSPLPWYGDILPFNTPLRIYEVSLQSYGAIMSDPRAASKRLVCP